MPCEPPDRVRSLVTDDHCVTEEESGSSHVDQRIIKDLMEKIQKLSEEHEQIESELHKRRIQTMRLHKELEDERQQKEAICAKFEKRENKFLKLNRVSLAVTREYADTLDQLQLEQSLRYEAESYASQV
ncbi:hypothetical protein GDO78_023044 [Eleutherodactylus coqui]|uniref:Uncharacterized protein n=1 Tax=Eleutherodactylus coqui TaxID=57060 RepID=A0A8J6EFT9_ELECQ|nr:hypothetical protein GDO78_023044 [Eleutherodactylus coqui]